MLSLIPLLHGFSANLSLVVQTKDMKQNTFFVIKTNKNQQLSTRINQEFKTLKKWIRIWLKFTQPFKLQLIHTWSSKYPSRLLSKISKNYLPTLGHFGISRVRSCEFFYDEVTLRFYIECTYFWFSSLAMVVNSKLNCDSFLSWLDSWPDLEVNL